MLRRGGVCGRHSEGAGGANSGARALYRVVQQDLDLKRTFLSCAFIKISCISGPNLLGPHFAVGNCEIESVDVEDARAVEGFVEWLDHNDIPGVNNCSTGRFAEEIFCSGEVHYAGQCIGAVVATSSNAASEAAKKVSDVLRTTLRSRVIHGQGHAAQYIIAMQFWIF